MHHFIACQTMVDRPAAVECQITDQSVLCASFPWITFSDPTGQKHPHIAVPCLQGNYEHNEDFLSYPAQNGYTRASLIEALSNGVGTDAVAFLQHWLYLGLLMQVFGSLPPPLSVRIQCLGMSYVHSSQSLFLDISFGMTLTAMNENQSGQRLTKR